jgi:hypothetical protein
MDFLLCYKLKYESDPKNKERRLIWSKEWNKRDYVKAKKKEYKLKNKSYIKKQSKEILPKTRNKRKSQE